MKFNKDYLIFPVIVIAGFIILCSIFLVEDIIVDNYFTFISGYYALLILLGFYLALLLGIILTGFITAYSFFNKCLSRTNGIIISAGAGMLAAFPLTFFYIHSPFLVIFGCVGGMGAYLFSLIDQSSQNTPQESEKQAGKRIGVKTTVILFIVSILLCMFVPLVISSTALIAGADNSSCGLHRSWNPSFKSIITRPDASSINVVMTGDYSLPQSVRLRYLMEPLKFPLKITIDGKDFSNQYVIRQQGLNATITPSDGINHYRDGMSILISGPDVMQNGSVGRHIILSNDYYQCKYSAESDPALIIDTYV
jgi:hypothetical protein